MVYIFFAIVAALVFLAISSDTIQIGSAIENTFRNAPFVIQNFYSVMSLITLLMTTAFVNSAALRDFSFDTSGIIFTKPINKFSYLLGRFAGATLTALVPLLGVSAGVILGSFYGAWSSPERYTSIDAWAHINSFLVFALPNTIFIAGIVFAIAVWTRSTIASFVGTLVLLVGYAVAGDFLRDLNNQNLAMMLDPFGINTFTIVTKYWTVSDKNSLSVGLTGWMLLNRLLWMAVGLAFFGLGVWRFSFAERARRGKTKKAEKSSQNAVSIPQVRLFDDAEAHLAQFLSEVRVNFLTVVKSTVFVVILFALAVNMLPALFYSTSEGFGIASLPVTYNIIDTIRGSSFLFLIAIITFFSGAMIWRERDAKLDEIYDALPFPTWIAFTAKFVALIGILLILFVLMIFCGVVAQAAKGYYDFNLPLYAVEFLVLDLLSFTFFIVLAMFAHVLAPNKYIGYFLFVALVIVNTFLSGYLEIASRLIRFGSFSSHTYSDFYGFAPYAAQMFWFGLYWTLFCGLLGTSAILLWQRGRDTTYRNRFGNAIKNLKSAPLIVALTFLIGFVTVGSYIYYQTLIVNTVQNKPQRDKERADYEKNYKQFQNLPQPRVIDVKYDIALKPETREFTMKSVQVIQNKTDKPIDKLHLTVDNSYDHQIQIDRATLETDDKRLNYRIYNLSPALQPNEQITMNLTVDYHNKGFENSLSNTQIMPDGTFFNNTVAPQIGYQPIVELTEKNDRRKQDLPEKDLMPALERDCNEHCRNTYISNNSDWVNVETVISTAPDQIAIAPGSLVKDWTENNRHYFQYRLDHKSLNFYSFMSARYEVARDEINNVKLEVYYHKGHEFNVPKMLAAMRKSYEYYTANFGEYKHKQLRIIEFPRLAGFAQAFPGTMPYSESIGFIADLEKPDAIDKVTYVVAHEIGHQWWAHQVVGANMQGATALSETLAQYSALLVMEKEQGRDNTRKFLEYEADNYLRSRGAERLKERPLQRVEASQGYIHYRKGSLVMYYLREMIGEDKVNAALREIVQNYAYKESPYPTSYVLTDALKKQTPPDLQYLYADLFDNITLFANRTTEATAKKRDDGKYDVTIKTIAQKFTADETGNETETPVNDFIEIGAFAAPEGNNRYGKTLYRERKRITAKENTFTFTTDELPAKAGIDPFDLLVDRQPEDNMKSVSSL